MFVEAYKASAGATWIMKPVGRAQGKGIFLVTKLADVADWKKDHKWKADAPQVPGPPPPAFTASWECV
jgi:tubulin polyglutamylase TTLL9